MGGLPWITHLSPKYSQIILRRGRGRIQTDIQERKPLTVKAEVGVRQPQAKDAVATRSCKRLAQILSLWREAGLLTPSLQPRETHFVCLASRTGRESISVVLSGTVCYSSHGKLIRCETNIPNAGGMNQQSAIPAWGPQTGQGSADHSALRGVLCVVGRLDSISHLPPGPTGWPEGSRTKAETR